MDKQASCKSYQRMGDLNKCCVLYRFYAETSMRKHLCKPVLSSSLPTHLWLSFLSLILWTGSKQPNTLKRSLLPAERDCQTKWYVEETILPSRHIIKRKYWYKHKTNLTSAIIWNMKVCDYSHSSHSCNAIQGWSLPIIFPAWKCSDGFHKTDLKFESVLLTAISGPSEEGGI